MNIETANGTIERVTGIVWDVLAEYVSILVDVEAINSKTKAYKVGHIEVTGDFDTTDIKRSMCIKLVYKNTSDSEAVRIATTHKLPIDASLPPIEE